MATDPVNYLAALGGLQSMPGSYAIKQGVAEDQAQLQQRQAQSALFTVQAQAAQQQQAEEADYKQAAMAALADGSPAAIASLITRFPKKGQAIAQGWDIKSAAEKQSDIASVGSVLSALDNGKHDLAASTMEARIAAEDARGDDTREDKAALAAIRSGDQAAINAIRGSLRYTLAAVVPDKMAEVLEKVGGSKGGTKGQVVGRAIGHYDEAGEWVTDYRDPDAPHYETVRPGETVVQTNADGDAPSGGISGADIESAALDAFPGTVVTSRKRTPEHNRAVGGVPNSDHLDDRARDLVPPEGVPMAKFAVEMRKRLPGAKIINEGDHVHIGAPKVAGGSRVVAQGAPKPGYALMTPQDNSALGLDPNVRYQRAPDGQITALGGQEKSQGQLKPTPQAPTQAILTNRSALRKIDDAIQQLRARPSSVGVGTGALGQTFLNWNDKAGITARAAVGKIGGQIIHDVSGAAVTMSEAPRFAPYVPLLTDSADTAIAKLEQLKKAAAAESSDLESAWGPENGYRGIKLGGADQPRAPVQIKSVQQYNKLAKGTAYIDPTGKHRIKG